MKIEKLLMVLDQPLFSRAQYEKKVIWRSMKQHEMRSRPVVGILSRGTVVKRCRQARADGGAGAVFDVLFFVLTLRSLVVVSLRL